MASEGWYKVELWFFDNCVIPLAIKLKECGVFGVLSDEYVSYAIGTISAIIGSNFLKNQAQAIVR
jgi:hypothetical protein